MSFPIFPTNPNLDVCKHVCTFEFLTKEERDKVEEIVSKIDYNEAKVINSDNNVDGRIDESARKSKVKWIFFNEETAWLFIKLMKLIEKVNNQNWAFDLIMAREPIQYTEYQGDGGHYDWHIDVGPRQFSQRKVSLSLLLSDPNSYEGGDLEIWPGGEVLKAERVEGGATVFPSFLLHRVTPVTKGVRKSLVFWVGGVPYK